MDKKKLRIVVCLCAICVVCVCTPANALANTINTEHVEYLDGYIYKSDFFVDYLLYFPSSFETRLIIGDITHEEFVYTWENCTMYVVTSENDVNVLSCYSSASGAIDLSNQLAFSSVGNFPLLESEVAIYEKITLFVVVVVALSAFILRLFVRRPTRNL